MFNVYVFLLNLSFTDFKKRVGLPLGLFLRTLIGLSVRYHNAYENICIKIHYMSKKKRKLKKQLLIHTHYLKGPPVVGLRKNFDNFFS